MSKKITFRDRLTTGNPIAWALMKATEGWQIFQPGLLWNDSDPSPVLKPPHRYGLKGFKEQDLELSTGDTVTAWYKPAEDGFPTIVVFHGNAGPLDTRRDYLKEITNSEHGRKFGVMIAAYPGFKGHVKRPLCQPSEERCIATGHAMVQDLIRNKQVPIENMMFFGESLGGAVALRIAYELQHEPIGAPKAVPAVVCWGTFSSMIRKANEVVPLVPADTLLKNRFESDKIISKVDNVLLLHSIDDEVTPYFHSEELHRKSEGKAELHLLSGINHCLLGEDGRTNPDHMREMVDWVHRFAAGKWSIPQPPVWEKERGRGYGRA